MCRVPSYCLGSLKCPRLETRAGFEPANTADTVKPGIASPAHFHSVTGSIRLSSRPAIETKERGDIVTPFAIQNDGLIFAQTPDVV